MLLLRETRQFQSLYFVIFVLTALTILFGHILIKHVNFSFALIGYNKTAALNPFVNVIAFLISAMGYYLAYNIYYTKRLTSIRIRTVRKLASQHFYMDSFIDFIFRDFIIFISKIFAFFEKYILNFIYSLPSVTAGFVSYLTIKFEARNMNSQFFIIILWITLILLLTSVLYFKTGIIR